MRAVFFILVLANVLFFSWQAGYLGVAEEKTREPERMTQQITPEKLRITSIDDGRKAATTVAAKAVPVCLESSSLPQTEADKLQSALAPLTPPLAVSSRKVEETAGWWVYLPPQRNKADAEKKTAELKQFGVDEFFIVAEDGPNKWAVSLGVFRTEEAARAYLSSINGKGVRTARAEERETRVTKTIFQVRELDEKLVARINDIKRDTVPGAEWKTCGA